MSVADSLIFEAQLPLQVLDDGVLGSLDVGVGGDARRPAAQRLLGKRLAAMRIEQKHVISSGKVKGVAVELSPVWNGLEAALPRVGPSKSGSDFCNSTSTAYLSSLLRQECHGSGSLGLND